LVIETASFTARLIRRRTDKQTESRADRLTLRVINSDSRRWFQNNSIPESLGAMEEDGVAWHSIKTLRAVECPSEENNKPVHHMIELF